MKKLLSTISYELENLALFEDRRFLKESSERYLFVNTKFLEVKYNKVLDPKKFIKYCSCQQRAN